MKRYIFGRIAEDNLVNPGEKHEQKNPTHFRRIRATKTWNLFNKMGKAAGTCAAALVVVYLGVAMSTSLDIRLLSDPATILSIKFKNGDIVSINKEVFPDDLFRIYIRDVVDIDNSGGLSREEIDSVEVVNVQDQEIYDLRGLELFPNIRDLNCLGSEVKAIPLSELTQVERIDARNCPLESLSLPSTAKQTIKELYIGMIEPTTWSPALFYYDPETKLIGYTNNYQYQNFEIDNPSFTRVFVNDLPGIPARGRDVRKNGRFTTEFLYINDVSSIGGFQSLEKLSCIGLNVSEICYCPSLKTVDTRVSTIETIYISGCDSLESVTVDRFTKCNGISENIVKHWERWLPTTSPGNIIDPNSSEYALILPYVELAYEEDYGNSQ